MSSCKTCGNTVTPGMAKCHFCGQEFHHTHFMIFKSKSSLKPERVSVGRRIAAGTIDTLYWCISVVVATFFLNQPLQESTPLQFMAQAWFILLLFSAFQTFMLVHDGQTLGKKVMGIAVVMHKTREHPSFVRIFLLRTVVPMLPFVLPVLGLSLYVINLFWGFGSDQRCLHDYIAGTEVVDA